jgi:hypothetical protein
MLGRPDWTGPQPKYPVADGSGTRSSAEQPEGRHRLALVLELVH